MTPFTYFSTASDVNVILSEALFLHVAAQIDILLMYNLMERLLRRKIFSVFIVIQLNLSTPPQDCKRFSTSSKEKKGKYKTEIKLKSTELIISTFFFFICINYMLATNNDLMKAKCAFAAALNE